MSAAAEKRLTDYKESLKSKAEKLVKNEFPQRIMELEDLIGTSAFKLHPAIKVERPVNIPIPKVTQSENGETGAGDKETAGKKEKNE